MLKNFYRIVDQSPLKYQEADTVQAIGSIRYIIELDSCHPVYNGHFPGNPVVPGVCQVQIIKELVSMTIKQELILFRSDNIKFLSMIIPEKTPVLQVKLDIKQKDPDRWDVNAIISHNEMLFIKFKGSFRPAK
jgi:3-hydroxyacyl-[acyl-carrier-protein] dehydratase